MKNFQLLSICFLLFAGGLLRAGAQAPAAAPAAPDAIKIPSTIDPAMAVEIRRMLELTGTTQRLQAMMQQMFAMFKARMPNVPPEKWDRMEKQMDLDELIERIIPLYDKYYSLDDLKAANAFYASPAGRRILAASPQIMHDSMQVGEEWGREMGMEAGHEMNGGYLQTPAPTTPVTPATHP
jgi:hypothetical protein